LKGFEFMATCGAGILIRWHSIPFWLQFLNFKPFGWA
jgi:hypothetical protein